MPVDVVEKNILLEPFQSKFFESKERFPCFKAAWGTGKTMVGIFKGILLSNVYNNNLGLIVRKKFTDLRDSTLKDFERYTGLKVPMSTKEITIPGTNSVIMFRHGDELSGLQNVNLGWAYIEQAEEFDTSEEFDMLRGRLRRELEINDNFIGFDDYEGYINWLKKNPLRCIMLIANANGHNWIWRGWKKLKIDGRAIYEAVTKDNIDNLPADFVADLENMKITSPKKYRRYVENSDDEEDIVGAYYAERLEILRKKGRMTKVSIDPTKPVYIVMDVGYTTAMWYFQDYGTDVKMVKYYQDTGIGIDEHAKRFKKWEKDNNLIIGEIFVPCDMDNNAQRVVHGDTALEVLRGFKYLVTSLPRESSVVSDGIPRTERFLERCWFDIDECEYGLDCLAHYRERTNESMSTETNIVYTGHPLKDGSDHCADAMRYASMVFEKGYFRPNKDTGLSNDRIQELARKYGR